MSFEESTLLNPNLLRRPLIARGPPPGRKALSPRLQKYSLYFLFYFQYHSKTADLMNNLSLDLHHLDHLNDWVLIF